MVLQKNCGSFSNRKMYFLVCLKSDERSSIEFNSYLINYARKWTKILKWIRPNLNFDCIEWLHLFLSLIFWNSHSTAQNAITSSNSPLQEERERSSIAADHLPWKTKPATCFTLRGERYASSSRLMVLSLLEYKDGTRTIEMILVSTVLPTIENWTAWMNLILSRLWDAMFKPVNSRHIRRMRALGLSS